MVMFNEQLRATATQFGTSNWANAINCIFVVSPTEIVATFPDILKWTENVPQKKAQKYKKKSRDVNPDNGE